MSKKTWKLLTILVLFSFLLSGCYYFSAKKDIGEAEGLLAELKRAEGEKLVPYEYTSAEKFLEISRHEFNESDFKQAAEFAIRSKSGSRAGLTQIRKK